MKHIQIESCLLVKTANFSPKIRNKEKVFAFAASIQYCTGASGLQA